jgi:hypothetical protein
MIRYRLILPTTVLLAFVLTASVPAQERPKWVAPRSGVWTVTGVDEGNTSWSGSLKIARQRPSGRGVGLRGFFDWQTSDAEAAGREYVRGSFDRMTGRIFLRGYKLNNERGELALGTYVAFVNRKGRRMNRGRWCGTDVIEGTWSAALTGSK